jgi:subtilase family serine protease
MLNPHAEVITSSGTDFAFLPGMTPGKTYYVTVDAYSSSGSFISSNEVAVHYSLISYLINILILVGVLAYIIFIVLFFMHRKKRKKELEDEEYEFFKYN